MEGSKDGVQAGDHEIPKFSTKLYGTFAVSMNNASLRVMALYLILSFGRGGTFDIEVISACLDLDLAIDVSLL